MNVKPYKCALCEQMITRRELVAAAADYEPSIVNVGCEVRRGWIDAKACDEREPLAHRSCRDAVVRKLIPAQAGI